MNFFLRHTHTHTFNGPLSRTTRVIRYQKGETNLDFTEARDSEWQWHQLGHMQVCTSLQTDNYASTPQVSFLQSGCPSCRPTNGVKALKDNWTSLQWGQNLRAPHDTRQQQLPTDIGYMLLARARPQQQTRRLLPLLLWMDGTDRRTDTRPFYDAYRMLCEPRNNLFMINCNKWQSGTDRPSDPLCLVTGDRPCQNSWNLRSCYSNSSVKPYRRRCRDRFIVFAGWH